MRAFSRDSVISMAAAGAYLIPCVIMDLRKQRIHVGLAAGGVVCAAIWMIIRIYQGTEGWLEFITCLLPGGVMLALCALTGGEIGIGDGVVLLGIGLLLGCRETFISLFLGLFFSSVWSGVLLVGRKAGKSSRIPWMPFLLAGYGTDMMIQLFSKTQV